jgi:hypothetical protein
VNLRTKNRTSAWIHAAGANPFTNIDASLPAISYPPVSVQQPPFTYISFPQLKTVRLEGIIWRRQLPRGKVGERAEERIQHPMNDLGPQPKEPSGRHLEVRQ